MGKRLQMVLDEQDMSQAELGRRIGVAPQSIQKLCSGESKKTRYTAEIAEVLNICPTWLATGDGLQTPWDGLGGEARVIAAVFDELPPHAQATVRDIVEALRRRYGNGKNGLHIANSGNC